MDERKVKILLLTLSAITSLATTLLTLYDLTKKR